MGDTLVVVVPVVFVVDFTVGFLNAFSISLVGILYMTYCGVMIGSILARQFPIAFPFSSATALTSLKEINVCSSELSLST